MWKLGRPSRLVLSLRSVALVIPMLGACAPLDQSQRGATLPTAASAQPSAQTWGFATVPAQPLGPTTWGFATVPDTEPSAPMVAGFDAIPSAEPTEPTLWGFATVPAEQPAAAVQASRGRSAPIAAKR